MTLDEIERRARELGVSYWDAITDLIEDEQRLSTRAVAVLLNFQKIINGLAAQASPLPATPMGRVRNVGWQARRPNTKAPLRKRRRGTTRSSAGSENEIESTSPVSDLVKAAIISTGYENALKAENNEEAEARLENLQELVNAAVDYDEQGAQGLRDFIDHSALVADTDQYKGDVPVTLMTAHSAKGLEFPLVFIVGLEDGLFPHARSLSDSSDIEEERRLCLRGDDARRAVSVRHARRNAPRLWRRVGFGAFAVPERNAAGIDRGYFSRPVVAVICARAGAAKTCGKRREVA